MPSPNIFVFPRANVMVTSHTRGYSKRLTIGSTVLAQKLTEPRSATKAGSFGPSPAAQGAGAGPPEASTRRGGCGRARAGSTCPRPRRTSSGTGARPGPPGAPAAR